MSLKKPLGPGDRIESRCTRCQDRTGHIIVAMINNEIVKVECCACGSTHKYYPIRPEKKQDSGVRRVKAGSDRKDAMKLESNTAAKVPSRTKSKSVAKALANEKAWREEMERPSAPEARAYAIDMPLKTNDIVDHSSFGLGAVIETVGSDKAKILFRDEVRTLRCQVMR